MLGPISPTDELTPPQGRSPCRLVLSESAQRLLEKKGAKPSLEGDGRRFPRHRTQGWAMLEYQPTFPSLPRPAESHPVLLVDISRGGVGLLHSEQLFPHEHSRLTLHHGKPREIEIKHCRRLGPNCYWAGCEFVKTA